VPFSTKVKVANPSAIPSFVTQAEVDAGYGSDYYTNLADAEGSGPPLPAVVPLMDIRTPADIETYKQRVNALVSGTNNEINRPFMKRSSVGATFAALMLDPAYHRIFGGARPNRLDGKTKKVVIMMTDSANLGCCFTNWPAGNFRGNYIYSYTPDHNALVGEDGKSGLCKAMKDNDYEVITVLFDVDPRDVNLRGGQIIEAFRECATNPAMAYEVKLNDRAKLEEVYTTIGKYLMNLRLVK
jgi:hypothetical protein